MRSKYGAGAKSTRAGGFALATLGYCCLAFFTALTPSRFGWWLCAILLLPLLTGAIAAKGTSALDTSGQRFSSGFWTCGVPMFLYAAVRLMTLHYRVGASGNAVGVLFVGTFVACVYALLAGLVAGMTGVLAFRQSGRTGGRA